MPVACSKPENPASTRFFYQFRHPDFASDSYFCSCNGKVREKLPSFITTPWMPSLGKGRSVPLPIARNDMPSSRTKARKRRISLSVRSWTKASADSQPSETIVFQRLHGEAILPTKFLQLFRKDHGRFSTAFYEGRAGLLPPPGNRTIAVRLSEGRADDSPLDMMKGEKIGSSSPSFHNAPENVEDLPLAGKEQHLVVRRQVKVIIPGVKCPSWDRSL